MAAYVCSYHGKTTQLLPSAAPKIFSYESYKRTSSEKKEY
jgi:hypothetical protein